jgi:hypothetical protein
MSITVYEQIVDLTEQLTDEERIKLARYLQEGLRSRSVSVNGQWMTREMLIADFAAKRAAGVFDKGESLYGKYARPDLDLNFEDIEAAIHEHSWEDELDEFYGKPD